MPTPTERNTQAIEDMARTVAVLTRQADESEKAIEQLTIQLERVVERATTQIEKVRSEAEQDRLKSAKLEHALDELRKSLERWGGRAWQFAAGAALLLVGAVLGYVLKR